VSVPGATTGQPETNDTKMPGPGIPVHDTDAVPLADRSGDASAAKYLDWQDIRLAIVMNGGVRLAICISGVTLELNHLVLSSRRYDLAWPITETREITP
jgi:hypothetical protein